MLRAGDVLLLFGLLIAGVGSLLFFISVAFNPADGPDGAASFLWSGLLGGAVVAALGAVMNRGSLAAHGWRQR